jgi:hypothetical protein
MGFWVYLLFSAYVFAAGSVGEEARKKFEKEVCGENVRTIRCGGVCGSWIGPLVAASNETIRICRGYALRLESHENRLVDSNKRFEGNVARMKEKKSAITALSTRPNATQAELLAANAAFSNSFASATNAAVDSLDHLSSWRTEIKDHRDSLSQAEKFEVNCTAQKEPFRAPCSQLTAQVRSKQESLRAAFSDQEKRIDERVAAIRSDNSYGHSRIDLARADVYARDSSRQAASLAGGATTSAPSGVSQRSPRQIQEQEERNANPQVRRLDEVNQRFVGDLVDRAGWLEISIINPRNFNSAPTA